MQLYNPLRTCPQFFTTCKKHDKYNKFFADIQTHIRTKMSALFDGTLLIIFKNTLTFLQNPHFISVLRLQFFKFFWIKNRACFFGSISINFSFALKMTFFIAYFLRNGLFSAFLGIFLDFSFFSFFVILNDKLHVYKKDTGFM